MKLLTILPTISDTNIWSNEITLPIAKDIKYRYFVRSSDASSEQIHIRKWETHLNPRQINAYAELTSAIDTFGEVNGLEKIDYGWLTTETIIQFKFFNNPFHLKEKLKNRILFVKVSLLITSGEFAF